MARTSTIEQAWDAYPRGASGGAGSALPRHRLDWEGRRFLAGTGSALAVADADARVVPVRAYVGTAHGLDPTDRARLAEGELRRLCEDAPRLLVVGCPTGTGYVSSAGLAAAELQVGGDCASVAIQFGSARSNDSTGAIHVARRQLDALLRQLAAATAAGWKPDNVMVWAESFGAWTLAEVLEDDPTLFDDFAVPVSVAWLGVPGPVLASSRLRAQVERRVDVERRWNDGDDVAADTAGDVLLIHRDDPVAHVTGTRLAFVPQRHTVPGLAGGDRRYGRRWLPLVTALRARTEVDLASRPGAREDLRRPHDYRYCAAHVVAAALGLPTPSGRHERAVTAAEFWAYDSFDRLGPAPCAGTPWSTELR